MSVKLSEHFSLSEFTFSSTAVRKGIDNTPDEKTIENLKALCIHVLEPIRAKLGKPIRITSGYRSKALNKAIGGSKTSQHVEGKAVDFHVEGCEIEELFQFIKRNGIEFDQLIQEFGEWIHISWNGFDNRNQALRATKVQGITSYTPA